MNKRGPDDLEASASPSSSKRQRKEANGNRPPLQSPWISSEVSHQLPPLPAIRDPSIEQQVFRHPGYANVREPSYERLEWLGDAYLEFTASAYIFSTFPNMAAGKCSQLRERLICNKQLAQYFRDYNLMPRAQVPQEVRYGLKRAPGRSQGTSADKDLVKVQADMFEAYVGAILTSDPGSGSQLAAAWLKDVWGRTIKEDIIKEEEKSTRTNPLLSNTATETTVGQDGSQQLASTPDPKQQLASAIVVPTVKLEYEKVDCNKKKPGTKLDMFAVKVTLKGWGEAGLVLGYGTGLSMKEAKTVAAEKILEDKKLVVRQFRDKKRDYLLRREAGAEDAERLMSRTSYLD